MVHGSENIQPARKLVIYQLSIIVEDLNRHSFTWNNLAIIAKAFVGFKCRDHVAKDTNGRPAVYLIDDHQCGMIELPCIFRGIPKKAFGNLKPNRIGSRNRYKSTNKISILSALMERGSEYTPMFARAARKGGFVRQFSLRKSSHAVRIDDGLAPFNK